METLECGHPPSPHVPCTTGYGVDADGSRYCYACCAERDKADMRKTGRAVLYLTLPPWTDGDAPVARRATFRRKPDDTLQHRLEMAKVTNWPGSLEFAARFTQGRHNIAGTRYDAWFAFEGETWHGVQYGENTQILHCRRVKG